MSIYRPREIAKTCNFTKSNTPSWVFLTFFKLCECYQIAQCITFTLFTYNRYLTRLCHPTEYLISPNLQLCGSNASVGNRAILPYFTCQIKRMSVHIACHRRVTFATYYSVSAKISIR